MSITSFLQRVGEVMNMSDKGIGGLFQPLFQYTGIINVSYFQDEKHQEFAEVL